METILLAALVMGQCGSGTCKIDYDAPKFTPNPFAVPTWNNTKVELLWEEWHALDEIDTSEWSMEDKLAHNKKKYAVKKKLKKADEERRAAILLFMRQQKAWQEKLARQARLRNKKVYYPNLSHMQRQVQAMSYRHFFYNCYTPYRRW